MDAKKFSGPKTFLAVSIISFVYMYVHRSKNRRDRRGNDNPSAYGPRPHEFDTTTQDEVKNMSSIPQLYGKFTHNRSYDVH
jgi:hypothetical protein